MKPVTPSSTISGTDPRLNAITGVPQAMASIMTRPNGSGQSMGTSKTVAPLKNSDFCAVVDFADKFDVCRLHHRLDLFLVILAIRVVDLGGDFQRHAAMLGDANGAVHTLFRSYAAKEAEI